MNTHKLKSKLSSLALVGLMAIPAMALKPEAKFAPTESGSAIQAVPDAKDPYRKGFKHQQKAMKAQEIIEERWIGKTIPDSKDPEQWLLKRLNKLLGKRNSAIQFESSRQDHLGNTHYQFQQYFRDIPIMDAILLVHVNSQGTIFAVSGKIQGNFKPINKQIINAAKAGESSLNQFVFKGEQKIDGTPRMVILDDMLAWEVRLTDLNGEPTSISYVDAQSGEVVHQRSLKLHAAPTGVGAAEDVSGIRLAGEDGQSVTFSGWKETSGNYYLYSYLNKWSVYDVDIPDWVQSSQSNWNSSDPTAVSLAHNMEKVQVYCSQILNWNSYNNLGTLMQANVHVGTNYVNAYWNGQTINFGDGDGISANALSTLDIVAHEFGHAITDYTSDLVYAYEPGALNESYSDIFGALVEFWAQADGRYAYPGRSAGLSDYLMGEDAWLEDVALRDMRNPQRFGQPSYYRGNLWYSGSGDNGGVHYNSGVQNFVFYVLAEGGTGTNDGHPYSLNGIGIEQAGAIAMYANMYLLTSNAQHQDSRDAWILAAQTLGYDADQVSSAWRAGGVFPPEPEMTLSPENQDLGVIALSQSKDIVFQVRNLGTLSASVTHLDYSRSGAEILTPVPFIVGAGASVEVRVRWTPSTKTAFADTLFVTTDDPDASWLMGFVIGSVGDAATITVTPTSLTESLLPGQSSTQMIHVSNDGEMPLQWSLTEMEEVQNLSGTRDAFGYRWIDSDEPGGPEFNWNSISSTGTQLVTVSNCDDCFQSIAQSFSYYGVDYSSIYVSSNGFVTLFAGSASYSHTSLPSISAPATIIAPYWTDLNPATAGDIYWQRLADRTIVQWERVALFGSSTSLASFQTHLLDNGNIEFYYNAMPTYSNYAVGMQDGTRAIGQLVSRNQSYVKNTHAVAFRKNSPWLSLSNVSGTVAGGTSVDIPVQFLTQGMANGTYTSTLRISHDVAGTDAIDIPVSLTIGEGSEPVVLTITASATTGGQITPVGELSVPQGQNQSFTITTQLGYHLQDLVVDGVSLGALESYTFTDVQSNHSIHAVFAINQYQITTLSSAGGSISPQNPMVNHGSTHIFQMIPESGYRVSEVFVDDVSRGQVSSVTLQNITSEHTVYAFFEIIPISNCIELPMPLAINWVFLNAWNDAANGSGFANTSDALEIKHRQWGKPDAWLVQKGVRYDFVKDQSYTLTFELKNDQTSPINALSFALASGTNWDSPMIVGATTTIAGPFVTSQYKQYSVQFIATATGSFHIALQQKWANQPSAIAKNYLKNLSICGGTTTPPIPPDPVNYIITASAGANGSINPNGQVVVNQGESITFTASPVSGYRVQSLIVDGISQGSISSYTFTSVNAAHSISVSFEVIPQGTCSESTALDLGGYGNESPNIPANSCLKITQYPSWWNNNSIRLGTTSQGQFPVNYQWSNCSSTGSSIFTGSWQEQILSGVTKTCTTLIQLQGNASNRIGLRWY